MKNIDEKKITLGQLKCIAELATHLMREINPNCEFVKNIDEFVMHVENYIIACEN